MRNLANRVRALEPAPQRPPLEISGFELVRAVAYIVNRGLLSRRVQEWEDAKQIAAFLQLDLNNFENQHQGAKVESNSLLVIKRCIDEQADEDGEA